MINARLDALERTRPSYVSSPAAVGKGTIKIDFDALHHNTKTLT